MQRIKSAPWGIGFAFVKVEKRREPLGVAGAAAVAVILASVVSAVALVAMNAGGAL